MSNRSEIPSHPRLNQNRTPPLLSFACFSEAKVCHDYRSLREIILESSFNEYHGRTKLMKEIRLAS